MKHITMMLLLSMAFSTTALAQESATAPAVADKAPFFATVDVGASLPFTELKTTFLVEAELGWAFLLDRRLGTSLSVGYTRPTAEGKVTYTTGLVGGTPTEAQEEYTSALDQTVLTLHFFGRLFGPDSAWTPWMAFGPSVYFLRNTVEAFDSTNEETETTFGFTGTLGADITLGPGDLTLLFRFPWAPTDSVTIGDSHLGATAFQVGYRFWF